MPVIFESSEHEAKGDNSTSNLHENGSKPNSLDRTRAFESNIIQPQPSTSQTVAVQEPQPGPSRVTNNMEPSNLSRRPFHYFTGDLSGAIGLGNYEDQSSSSSSLSSSMSELYNPELSAAGSESSRNMLNNATARRPEPECDSSSSSDSESERELKIHMYSAYCAEHVEIFNGLL